MICPAQASKNNSQQLAGLAAKTTAADDLAGLSPCSAGKWREYGGAGPQKAGSDLPNLSVSLPPIAFAWHCLYPLP